MIHETKLEIKIVYFKNRSTYWLQAKIIYENDPMKQGSRIYERKGELMF